MRLTGVPSVLVASLAVLGLVACSALPLPHEVDLKAQISDPKGEITTEVGAGKVEELDLRVPTDEGECFVFEDVAPGATVHSAQLQWIVDVHYEGPELSGKVQGRAYVAGEGEDVFQASNTLGPVITVDLSRTSQRLAGAANLNPDQLAAINDRVICWGAHLTGQDVTAQEDGTATIGYAIERLRLRVTFSVI